MINFRHIHGSPIILCIFLVVSLLTRFNISFSIIYPIFVSYCCLFLILILYNNGKVYISNNYILFINLLAFSYLALVITFYGLTGISDLNLPHSWDKLSTYALMSLLLVHIVILMTPLKETLNALIIVKYVSYSLIVESFLFYVLPQSVNFLSSDAVSGYRFSGLFLNSYIKAGVFLVAGYVIQFQLARVVSKKRFLLTFILYLIAILATKDRTTILSFILINIFLVYRSTLSVSPFKFKLRKRLFALFFILVTVSVPLYLWTAVLQKNVNALSFESSIHRVLINMRAYEVFESVLPFGSGPGSQVRLIYDDAIPTNILDVEMPVKNDRLENEFNRKKDIFYREIGSSKKISTHNTYVDFLIPMGFFGLFIVISIFWGQLKCFARLLFVKKNYIVFNEALILSSFILFSFSSVLNILWVFMLIYRSNSIFEFNKTRGLNVSSV